MTIDDVFGIRGRGTVAVGTIEQGAVRVGDEIILTHQGATRKVVVTGTELIIKQSPDAGVTRVVGLVFKDLTRDELQSGDLLSGADTNSGSSDFSIRP